MSATAGTEIPSKELSATAGTEIPGRSNQRAPAPLDCHSGGLQGVLQDHRAGVPHPEGGQAHPGVGPPALHLHPSEGTLKPTFRGLPDSPIN